MLTFFLLHATGNVCRVCGRKLKAKKKRVMTYACSSHQQGLERAFSINVEKDTPDVQPTSFCLACYMVMQRSDKAATKGTPYNTLWRYMSGYHMTLRSAESVHKLVTTIHILT